MTPPGPAGRTGERGRPARRCASTPRRGRWLPALALALGACAPEPAPGPPPGAPAAPLASEVPVSGEVAVAAQGGARLALLGAEVLFVPEEAMKPYLAARVVAASAGLVQLGVERERARAEHREALAEADRTNQAWKLTNDNDLRRRLELQFRQPRTAEGVKAGHRRLLEEKQAAWGRAVAAARRSDEVERAVNALQARAARFREGAYFLQGLPPAVKAAHAGPDGTFGVSLEPGRYALVATAERRQGVASDVLVWLLWTQVERGPGLRVALSGANLHGTDCPDCAVAVRRLAGATATGGQE